MTVFAENYQYSVLKLMNVCKQNTGKEVERMASKITEQQVEHVAELAKLEFPKDELGKFTTQLGSIIDMFEDLTAVDTDGVEPMTSATDRVNVMREDKAVKATKEETEALLKNAPDEDGGYIRVPVIIDESEDGE
jgi:aspartyl-tRNA(Asn)/glutamyl-tRNA(Gln) amidotransferase subunit C